jgi:two-component sensor histidine kinase
MSYATVQTPRTQDAPGTQDTYVYEPGRRSIHTTRDREDDALTRQQIDLRQLRHHTKNTLQRILGLIAEAPGLCDTQAGEKIAQDLEYRIGLSATISDALFGLTDTPASMIERLRRLAGAMVDMMRDHDQSIRIGASVRGCCPPPLRETILRCAHELIGNAVKHGLKGRPSGRIAVRLISEPYHTTLTVLDNGWGFILPPQSGEGLTLARRLAAAQGGSLSIDGQDGTVATLVLPH